MFISGTNTTTMKTLVVLQILLHLATFYRPLISSEQFCPTVSILDPSVKSFSIRPCSEKFFVEVVCAAVPIVQ
jgi:hypothetical protein